MRVLVTGGAGFIGSHVAEELVARGDRVLVADSCVGGNNIVPGTELAQVDLACDDLQALVDFAPEVVFHAAANAREGASQFQPAAVCAANVMASARTFEAAILGGALKRVVFTTSMARYGEGRSFLGGYLDPPFDENTHRPAPVDVYGHCKVQVEGMLQVLAKVHDFAWAILVPHNVIGPRQRLQDRFRNVAAITMNRIMRGEPIIVFGDGQQLRAFSAIEDSLLCMVAAVDGAIDGKIVNVGGSVPITINQLIIAIRKAMGASHDYPSVYLQGRPLEVTNAHCTTVMSERLLGYREYVGWETCIEYMAAWARSVGPVDWSTEQLTLINDKTPKVWR